MESSSPLAGARIVLGVTGGIACYKVVGLARTLEREGCDVHVVMTHSAGEFVGPASFAALTGNPVLTWTFEDPERLYHIKLAREADLVVVAPATAHLIARYACGLADDLLTNVLLVARCPVAVAPAMHSEMWLHAATQANVATLRSRGVSIIEPASGRLASGDEGPGRLAEKETILAEIRRLLTPAGVLAGKRVLVTAGGTQEPLDPVRFLGNRSSGKMGFAIAAQAAERGADVDLIAGPSALADPPGVRVKRVRTAAEMRQAVLEVFPHVDVVVKAAAVADFRPARPSESKIKKGEGVPHIELEPTLDILAELGATKTGQLLVGFSAETQDAIGNARKKLEAKRLDLVVGNLVNRPGAGFGSDRNAAVLVDREGGLEEVPLVDKHVLARIILDRVEALLTRGDRGEG